MSSGHENRLQESAPRIRVTDVARRARCAPATVSRAINNPEKVSPDKRARIEVAMRELGYVRNHAARALRSQRSHMVGVLIPTLDYAIYARLVGAANARLSKAGISTLIAIFDYNLDAELHEARLLLERGAEALILVGDLHRPELFKLLDQYAVPFVNTYTFSPKGNCPTVGFDNAAAAAKLARHLIHLGHRSIAVISGITKDNDRTTKRLAGIEAELAEHGLNLPKSLIAERAYTISEGRKACALFLARTDRRPTAVICGNDVLAMGALIECNAQGLDVPGDISIVGFDNLEYAAHANPPLTTIDVPAEDMGANAADYILGQLNGQEVDAHNSVEVRLILRNSSAPPKLIDADQSLLRN